MKAIFVFLLALLAVSVTAQEVLSEAESSFENENESLSEDIASSEDVMTEEEPEETSSEKVSDSEEPEETSSEKVSDSEETAETEEEPEDVSENVEDLDEGFLKFCRSTGDPHITAFNRKRFNIYKVGTFTLFKYKRLRIRTRTAIAPRWYNRAVNKHVSVYYGRRRLHSINVWGRRSVRLNLPYGVKLRVYKNNRFRNRRNNYINITVQARSHIAKRSSGICNRKNRGHPANSAFYRRKLRNLANDLKRTFRLRNFNFNSLWRRYCPNYVHPTFAGKYFCRKDAFMRRVNRRGNYRRRQRQSISVLRRLQRHFNKKFGCRRRFQCRWVRRRIRVRVSAICRRGRRRRRCYRWRWVYRRYRVCHYRSMCNSCNPRCYRHKFFRSRRIISVGCVNKRCTRIAKRPHIIRQVHYRVRCMCTRGRRRTLRTRTF